MRLLHVICTTDAESGGPIEGILRTSELMHRLGHEIEIVSIESPEDAAARGFPMKHNGVGRGLGRYAFNLDLTRWIKQHAASFDSIVLHGLWNFSSVGAWLALRKSRVPYHVYVHGMLGLWFKDRYPLKHVLKQIYWWLFEGRVLRDAQSVIFTCVEERDTARQAFHGFTYQERVISLGTTDPDGDPKWQESMFLNAFPTLQGKKYLLFLSRIHPKKACDNLIQAWSNCLRDVPADMDLVIAGPDQVGWMADLQKLAARLGVTNRIHWTGMLAGEMKWGALRCAEALILPTHHENFGIVIAEALACSTPVLISDKVNIWREVQATGAALVESDTVEGTTQLIQRFLKLDAETRQSMARAARKGFLEHFSIESSIHDFATAIGFDPA